MPRTGKNHGPQKAQGVVGALWFRKRVISGKKRNKIAKQSRRKNR